MPLKTYYNLPEEKQKRIIKAAIAEFASNGYQKGSIQSIADRAGISKGSMYQYFTNKKELFLYIFDIAIDKKINGVKNIISRYRKLTIYELLEKAFEDSIKYAREYPSLYQIYTRAIKGAPREIINSLDFKIKTEGLSFYLKLLTEARENGQVRDDINLELATFVVFTLCKYFGEYLGQKIPRSSEKEIKHNVRDFLKVLKEGLLPQEHEEVCKND
ncbi:TetR/AcrR family transcriptional regulator [Halothermothrix orenii]|uniref:Transcriptional regulator, TetR family n=1 Tax=Halothermothrix orenii (strain H 168 / OCM 544 / DSM 9562) TaxID=373903 RepID=B8D1Q6_HALOH|nr:TetR/AcrR family transcriptional regulator [Halothermothrix orenii]ACL69133.1 transcriptional regulator, TetR family [Halothermothrix orenii H 168]